MLQAHKGINNMNCMCRLIRITCFVVVACSSLLLNVLFVVVNFGLAQPLTRLSDPGDAVCLDGSPPAYSIDRGSGSGLNNWIVHLQGGAWCGSIDDCEQRSRTILGSSKYMTGFFFEGLLSNSPSDNPDFYNWNRVFVGYCDGGGFAGNIDTSIQASNSTLYFRGKKVWEAIIDDLLRQGLANAQRAILSGDSAGGSATIFHCNRFQERLQATTDVKCLCNGGFFMDIPNVAGEYSFQDYFQHVVTLHNIDLVPSECASKYSITQCFFPEYSLSYVNVPIFILQSPIDYNQVRYILAPSSSYSNGYWDSCKQDISTCSTTQLQIIQDQLRGKMLATLSSLVGYQRWGMYMISCYYHTETFDNRIWNGVATIDGMNPAQAFHQWYFGGQLVQEIDCPYPCNPTCVNISV